jgi:alpha-tubulin suppressor-like RCC1 family protein/uncharacterized protein YjdB
MRVQLPRAVLSAAVLLAAALACRGDGPTGPAFAIADLALRPGVVNSPYADTLDATGGGRAKSWSLVGGTLPPGIALASSGVLSGTPTAAGTSTFDIRVTSAGKKRTRTFTIQVLPPVVIATNALPGASQSQPYSTVLSATGGTGVYAWAIAAGTLPAGLTLSAAGEIAGTPTTFGTDTVTISVTSGTQLITKVFALTVVPSLTITTASLRDGTVGETYADTLRALGTGPSAAWGVESGALPAGLTLLSSGVLSGTPTTAGVSDFTVQVTSGAQVATRALQVTVVAALVLETSTLPNGTVGNPYSRVLAASGGTGTYGWSVVAGALPAGLSLSAAGLVGGTPTTPSNNAFTVRVTSGAQQRERAFSVQISSADAASVRITPDAGSVELGDSLQLAAEALDAGGVPLPGRPIAWSTLNANVTTVSGAGLVRGISLGSVGIVASATGAGGAIISDTAIVTVTPRPVDSVEVVPARASLLIGETQQLSATMRDRFGNVLAGRTVTWASSDANIAAIDANTGLVTSGATGEATITALSEGVTGTGTVLVSRGLILTAVQGGSQHSCGLSEAGLVFCWGRNAEGQLGDSSRVARVNPVRVRGSTSFAQLDVGYSHGCALTAAGAAHCWGSNSAGRLGDGTNEDRLTPVPVSGGLAFVEIEAGGTHSCGLTAGGTAYCWGLNISGQLGDNSTNSRTVPTLVAGGHTFASLALGGNHSCGVTTAGAAYCWGLNAFAQIGDGTTGSLNNRIVPTAVTGGLTFARLSAASEHTCGITTGGETYCWGSNGSNPTLAGRLGDGTTVASRPSPTLVVGGLVFTDIVTSGVFTCGRTAIGEVRCWGANDTGQLGDGTFTSRTAPTPLSGGVTWDALGVGNFHGCAIRDAGRTFCWGQNTQGAVGDGTVANRETPVPVRP